MKFKFFSQASPQSRLSIMHSSTVPEDESPEAERAALNEALYGLLESLPRAAADKDQIRRLCDTVLDASPRLRLVWVGFAEDDDERIVPHALAGEAVTEAEDWRLPCACFAHETPYAQAALETGGGLNDLNSLFAPWLDNMNDCSVHSALAIPLRSEKREMRGLVVFYADDVNYFSRLGAAPFHAFGHVAEIIWRQSSLMQLLAHKAQIDALTGLMNRRKMSHLLKAAVDRAERQNELLSVMILRIDRFGRLNERFGWSAADTLLANFANEIVLQMRAQDRLARWTGVEFLYLMPRTDLRHAEFLAHGLQAYFSTHPLRVKDQWVELDVQIGVASYTRSTGGLDELLREAGQRIRASFPNI